MRRNQFGSPKRTRAQKKSAAFQRLIMGRNPPSLDELVAAGYGRDEAERLLSERGLV